jgi:hypothetical protein
MLAAAGEWVRFICSRFNLKIFLNPSPEEKDLNATGFSKLSALKLV